MGNKGCGQITTSPLCCSFLLTLCPCSALGPSHWLWAMGCCCCLCSLHRLQGNLCTHTWSSSSPPSTLTLFNLTPLCQKVFSIIYKCFSIGLRSLPYPGSSALSCGRAHWSGLGISPCKQHKPLHISTASYRFGPMARISARWDHGMSTDCWISVLEGDLTGQWGNMLSPLDSQNLLVAEQQQHL